MSGFYNGQTDCNLLESNDMDSELGFSGGPVYLLPSNSANNRLSKTKTSKKNPRIFIGVWKGGRYAKELMNDEQRRIYKEDRGQSDCPV